MLTNWEVSRRSTQAECRQTFPFGSFKQTKRADDDTALSQSQKDKEPVDKKFRPLSTPDDR